MGIKKNNVPLVGVNPIKANLMYFAVELWQILKGIIKK